MVAYLKRAPSGVAGDVTRQLDTIVEPGFLNPANPPSAFGVPVKLVDGKFELAKGAAGFYGILSRVAPSIAGDTAQTFLSATPNPQSVQGIVVKGYINVLCPTGTPTRGGQVYVTSAGAFSADSAGNEALPGVVWAVDGKDASNVAEVRII